MHAAGRLHSRFTDSGRYPFRRRLQTVYADMDAQGHVNNVAIARFFEEARFSLQRMAWAALPETRRGLVLASVRIDYLREVSYPGEVEVAMGIGRIGTSSFEQTGALFQNGECAAVTSATSVRMARDRSRTVPLTEAEREALARYVFTE